MYTKVSNSAFVPVNMLSNDRLLICGLLVAFLPSLFPGARCSLGATTAINSVSCSFNVSFAKRALMCSILDLVLDVIGTPTLDEFYAITSRRSREYIRSLPIRRKRSFASLFPHASTDAIDFLNKTLVRYFLSSVNQMLTPFTDIRPQEAYDC